MNALEIVSGGGGSKSSPLMLYDKRGVVHNNGKQFGLKTRHLNKPYRRRILVTLASRAEHVLPNLQYTVAHCITIESLNVYVHSQYPKRAS
jgi:hypothetical protein